jgi:hypothetical protein
VTGAIAWQATLVAVAAAVVGIPFGLIGGRWGWRLIADRAGLQSISTTPLVVVALAAAVAVVVANLIALWPAMQSARHRLADALRAE